jgi:hypothetical protein
MVWVMVVMLEKELWVKELELLLVRQMVSMLAYELGCQKVAW